jgi:hypothetical protein
VAAAKPWPAAAPAPVKPLGIGKPTPTRPVARPAESGFGEPAGGFGSESDSGLGSERIKIGERPPEQSWPGGSKG